MSSAQSQSLQPQELLLNTQLPYTEVAAQCGYNNESSLILIYEKRLKTTPHIFRTGYRIINTNYTFNRHGYSNPLYGEKRGAKNKVYSKKWFILLRVLALACHNRGMLKRVRCLGCRDHCMLKQVHGIECCDYFMLKRVHCLVCYGCFILKRVHGEVCQGIYLIKVIPIDWIMCEFLSDWLWLLTS